MSTHTHTDQNARERSLVSETMNDANFHPISPIFMFYISQMYYNVHVDKMTSVSRNENIVS